MIGYPHGMRKGTESVGISRDPDNYYENLKLNGEYVSRNMRFDHIYSINKKNIRGIYRPLSTLLDELEIVKEQVRFYRDRGWKIIVVDTDELFHIRAEKEVDA